MTAVIRKLHSNKKVNIIAHMGGFSDVLGAAAAPLTTLGSLGSAAIQRQWALKDWNRVNAYNHPSQQISRLKEAGLPLASMFSGSGGSTSSDVGRSEVDPTLGVGKGLEQFFQNRLQRKQLELMDEQINTQKALGDKEWALALDAHTNAHRNTARFNWEGLDEGKSDMEIGSGPASNLVKGLVRERQVKEIERLGGEIGNKLREADIDYRNKQKEHTIAEIDRVLQEIKQSSTRFENEQKFVAFRNEVLDRWIGEDIQSASALKTLIISLLTKFLYGNPR